MERQPPLDGLFRQVVHRGPGTADEVDAPRHHVRQDARELPGMGGGHDPQAVGTQQQHAVGSRDLRQALLLRLALRAQFPEARAQHHDGLGTLAGQGLQGWPHLGRRHHDEGQFRDERQFLDGGIGPHALDDRVPGMHHQQFPGEAFGQEVP